MEKVGEEYERGERFIPEMLVAADAMKAAMVSLRPRLQEAGIRPRGRVVLGTVDGDLHDIGKNLVGMMLEGAGFEVIDLGVEVPSETFVEAVREHRPEILALSALLTTTMIHMPEVIEALRSAGLRGGVQVMVGGAPVTQEYAERIGADGYAADAPSAVTLAKRLVGE
jgi:5-methyltetrahydrofolate--homocysteine methyltransferase